jgi:hypothetical protein
MFSKPGPRGPGTSSQLRGPVSVAGLTYSHTFWPEEVTSKSLPFTPSSISVFPFGRRWAPEVWDEKKSSTGDEL